MHTSRDHLLVAGALLAALTAAGCTDRSATAVEQESQTHVSPIPGTDRSQVVVTAEGAQRIGIKTELVRATAVGVVIPLAAVLYDNVGRTWAYTNPTPLTFVPQQLVISRVQGLDAVLHSGPAVGTRVVTVGGAELLGAEYGVPGE